MESIRALSTLAILKVHADETDSPHRDYIDLFIPLFEKALADIGNAEFPLSLMKEKLKSLFGINVPTYPIESILNRLCSRDKLEKIICAGQVLYRKKVEFLSHEYDRTRQKITTQNETLVANIIHYAKDVHGTAWDKNQAEDELVEYLTNFSVSFLRAKYENGVLPRTSSHDEKGQKIVNSYVKKVSLGKEEDFGTISNLVKGHMLSNALLCPDLSRISQKFEKNYFYLDTPVILNLFGLQGPYRFTATQELVKMLIELGGQPVVFAHTAQEITNIIKWCIANFENPKAHNIVLNEARIQNKKITDLVMVKDNLEFELKKYQVYIRETPEYHQELQINETDFADALEDEVKYLSENALKYDVNSVRSIFALRKNLKPRRLEECSAIFVSSNSKFAKVAKSYGKEEEFEYLTTVITDFELANIAWLKMPIKSEFPELEIVSSCYAALEPSESLWVKYLHAIDDLAKNEKHSPEELLVLRSHKARELLVETALSEETIITGEVAGKILEKLREVLLKGKQKELEAEQQRGQSYLNELNDHKAKGLRQEKRVHAISAFCGKTTKYLCLGLISPGLAYMLISVLPEKNLIADNFWSAWLLFSLVLLGVYKLINVYVKIFYYLDKVAHWVDKKIACCIRDAFFE